MSNNNNQLIAEFMGVKIGVDSYSYRPGQSDLLKEENLNYHKSWGWLLPVVEKIESLDLKEYGYQWEGIDGKTEYNNGSICVEIEQNRCWIYMNLQLDPFHTFNEKSRGIDFPTKIEAVYAAVVEFIEYYNELITRKDEE
jgi:hypothetical protein